MEGNSLTYRKAKSALLDDQGAAMHSSWTERPLAKDSHKKMFPVKVAQNDVHKLLAPTK